MSQSQWTPVSWKDKPVAQAVQYPDATHLNNRVLTKLETLPPLVTPSEVPPLRALQTWQNATKHSSYMREIAPRASTRVRMEGLVYSLLCWRKDNISAKIGLILSFSLILVWGARLPVVRIGRIAGQYAKPRSSSYERVGDREVLSFRGDNVNGLDVNDRTPDPERLLRYTNAVSFSSPEAHHSFQSAYFHSATTLNYVRGLLSSGFASLHHPRDWSLAHVRSPALRREFSQIIDALGDALDFSRTIGVDGATAPYERGGARTTLGEVDFYTSHEGLMLDYEQAFTRALPVPNTTASPEGKQAHYNTSAHFLWIGDRTRQLTGAHVEYFRGIRNPIGIKVGPSMQGEELVRLLDIVNPDREPGRVTLITRYGANKVAPADETQIQDHLPTHITSVQATGHPVVWICDPMHGNTQTSSSGLKTRHFGTIISEIVDCLRIHAAHDSRLGGVSLEFTGELNDEGFSVTELNFEQSLDVAFLISNHLKKERSGSGTDGKGDVLYAELAGRFAAKK
ncbi:hypothetical protein DXG01_004015 [Tephrocybe rancida]|nr:hypothetical protein DXG01_004015 [Tephrocybe rancida]